MNNNFNIQDSRFRNGKTDVSLNEKETMDLDTLLDIYLHNDKDGVCCICGKPYHDYGANAMPLADGRCCHECDKSLVIPLRGLLAQEGISYAYVSEPVFKEEEVKRLWESINGRNAL